MGLGGLIAGALGGAAKGYVETSQSELRKQQSLDLQKQMMAMEEEKQLRMDEIRRERDIAGIGKKSDAETDAAVRNAPRLAQSKVDSRVAELGAAQKAGLPAMEADAAAQVEAAKYNALLKAGVPAAKAAADAAAFAAGADLRKAQANEKGELEGASQVAKTGVAGYTDSLKQETDAKESTSTGKKNEAAADWYDERPRESGRGGGGSAGNRPPTVRSTYVNGEGFRVAVMSDGTEKALGRAGDFDNRVANLITRMAKDDFKFAKLPESEKRRIAIERLTGASSSSGASADPASRPALSSFQKQ